MSWGDHTYTHTLTHYEHYLCGSTLNQLAPFTWKSKLVHVHYFTAIFRIEIFSGQSKCGGMSAWAGIHAPPLQPPAASREGNGKGNGRAMGGADGGRGIKAGAFGGDQRLGAKLSKSWAEQHRGQRLAQDSCARTDTHSAAQWQSPTCSRPSSQPHSFSRSGFTSTLTVTISSLT